MRAPEPPPTDPPSLFSLWLSFLQIGAFTFGGGYAMLPMLEREVVDRHRWATREELLDYYAIAQSTPGVIAVNVATFVGTKLRGLPGAIATTVGVNTASFFVILALASALKRLAGDAVFQHAIAGVQVAVAALITAAVIRLWKKAVVGWLGWLLFSLGLSLILFFHISPAFVVLGAVAIGLGLGFARLRGASK